MRGESREGDAVMRGGGGGDVGVWDMFGHTNSVINSVAN